MSASDIFFLIVRWLHLLAAASWIGGSIFYLLILRPALLKSSQSIGELTAFTVTEFRALVNACIIVLIITGVILGADRLTVNVVSLPYVVTLGTKTLLSIWMFFMVWDLQRQAANQNRLRGLKQYGKTRLQVIIGSLSGYNTIVIVGIAVFLLSDLLKILFEIALASN